jgi:hypothetical protein
MTNIVALKVAIVTLLTTNVTPLKPSEGFPEREFLTNIVQTTTYSFGTNTFTEVKTNSSIVGVYIPVVRTNFVFKSSYPATPGQLGQPINAFIQWHSDTTNASSANSAPEQGDTTSSRNRKAERQ